MSLVIPLVDDDPLPMDNYSDDSQDQNQLANVDKNKVSFTYNTKFKIPQDTPSSRTGPPRSLSYHFTTPRSPGPTRSCTFPEIFEPRQGSQSSSAFTSNESNFRSAFEPVALEQDRKGKRRATRQDSWNPVKLFHDSIKEENSNLDSKSGRNRDDLKSGEADQNNSPPAFLSRKGRRSFSVPHSTVDTNKSGWGRLRSLLPSVSQAIQSPTTPSAVTSYRVNITDELITGGLSTLMLRLWFERDEKGHRRIPVLLHRLRIRVSDSLHPLHANKSVFRIECEYANGAGRWVIYRQLRDFLSLHTHYKVSNAVNRNSDQLPEFPRHSLPYFKFLNKELRDKGKEMGKVEFARRQREALETYLIDLIRAVMFHPSANRLAGFLEISALSIFLARSCGFQTKAGYLRIKSRNKGAGFGRKSVSWVERQESRWCAVRESYLVVLEEPGELAIWDVFLFDTDFKIERPKRYYRQSLSFLHSESHKGNSGNPKPHSTDGHADSLSVMGTIRYRLSQVFPVRHHSLGHEGQDASISPSRSHPEPTGSTSSSLSSIPHSRAPTPILDPSVNTNPLAGGEGELDEMAEKPIETQPGDKKKATDVSMHTFYIENSQMRLKLVAHNQRQMLQWITALEKATAHSPYTGHNRFDSFAPVRFNVAAQWLVDGRDYFWNLSKAISMARDTILIHDWWLSPELQMRRPNQAKYQLDNLLEKKAKAGVKIYILIYQEVSLRTTPTDSGYAKHKLTSLHHNIMVQRSPSHFQTGTFYWAHHEKICVIDHTIAFMGGLDLCFGRWDTPQHSLVDDPGPEQAQIWPGKDYCNARVSDFHTLHKPEEDLHDRTKVPRMPWHDVGMQVVGQPARDLARHFVERWNYLLRIKNHTRVMPFLLPPPEFQIGELHQLGLTGTCEMQICRSAGSWSMGTPNKIEHSIQNAHLKAIQLSEHFVYIENQFFITSTTVNDIHIENKIGEALVNRILRAHRERTPWKCCIVIPAMPGFAFPVDHSDASALRIIMELQNRSISRGPNSIYSRLKKEGIQPRDYISVFALRKWDKLRGDVLTTEQIYIHGKTFIVDDRLAIIGSANINERSQRGDRDSEIAAVIRDTDMIDCTMAGKPFKVGRFAHTLRVRLMQEHLGVDVDNLLDDGSMASGVPTLEPDRRELHPDAGQEIGRGVTRVTSTRAPTAGLAELAEGAKALAQKNVDRSGTIGNGLQDRGPASLPRDDKKTSGLANLVVHTLNEKMTENHSLKAQVNDEPIVDKEQGTSGLASTSSPSPQTALLGENLPEPPSLHQLTSLATSLDHPPHEDSPASNGEQTASGAASQKHPHDIDPRGFEDPISDEFWRNVWVASALHNTNIYRKVFHAIPDDSVTTWREYKDFVAHHERLNMPTRGTTPTGSVPRVHEVRDAPGPITHQPNDPRPPHTPSSAEHARGQKPFERWEREEMEKTLGELRGHLVLYANRFLEGEDNANNFLFNADKLLPMPIYD